MVWVSEWVRRSLVLLAIVLRSEHVCLALFKGMPIDRQTDRCGSARKQLSNNWYTNVWHSCAGIQTNALFVVFVVLALRERNLHIPYLPEPSHMGWLLAARADFVQISDYNQSIVSVTLEWWGWAQFHTNWFIYKFSFKTKLIKIR